MTKFIEMGTVEATPLERRQGGVTPKAFKLDPKDLAERLSRVGREVDPGKLALKVMNQDFSDLHAKQAARVRWETWDRVSPINGVDASVVLSQKEYAEAEVSYLIYVDDRVSVFQPMVPQAAGNQHMTLEEAAYVAEFHAAELVDGLVINEIFSIFYNDPDIVADSRALQAEDIADAVLAVMQRDAPGPGRARWRAGGSP